MTNQFTFQKPLSFDQFEQRFPDDEAYAEDLFRRRWSYGFVCPVCGSGSASRLKRKRCVRQCRDCWKQTSVTAGTFMHRSHVSLRNWYRALHVMTAHSNGMSALQLQRQRHLGLGSYKSAWTLVHKIRRAMEVADGFPLTASVQADETSVSYRPKNSDPLPGGRSSEGKLMIAAAVEVFEDNTPGRVKLRRIADQSAPTLKAFVERATVRGARVVTDGWVGYSGVENHKPVAVGAKAKPPRAKFLRRNPPSGPRPRADPLKSRRAPRGRAGIRSIQPNLQVETPASSDRLHVVVAVSKK